MNLTQRANSIAAQLACENISLYSETYDLLEKGNWSPEQREIFANALAHQYHTTSDVRVKLDLLDIIGKADAYIGYEVAFSDLKKITGAACMQSAFLYCALKTIGNHRYFLKGLSSVGLEKNIRLAYALLHDEEIINGDYKDADGRAQMEFSLPMSEDFKLMLMEK